jgi:N-methylhydantoinase A
MLNQHDTDAEQLLRLFHSLDEKGKDDLMSEGADEREIFLERYLDMRYKGQSYEIIVPFNNDYIEGFHGLHERNYGYRNRDKTVEIVNLRLRARGIPDKPRFKRLKASSIIPPDEALIGQKEVIFDYQPLKTPIFKRECLKTGNRIEGPAVLVEYSSTVVVPPFVEAFVDGYGNLIMEIR